MEDYLDRHDRMIKLKQPLGVTAKKGNIAFALAFGCIGAMLATGIKSCESETQPVAVMRDCIECHNRSMEMSQYFQRHGVDRPEALAKAVLHPSVKRPKLMAAMAVKESPRQKVGDSGQSKGYYQVKEKHWRHLLEEKRVSKNPLTQTTDSQRILDALIDEKGGLSKGLNAYGGSSSGNYSKMILAELVRVP